MKETNLSQKPDFDKIKQIGFLGFGKSCRGAYEYLKKKHPHISFVLRDEKDRETFPDGFKRYCYGKDAFLNISEEMLILSPSVSRDRPELASAKQKGRLR